MDDKPDAVESQGKQRLIRGMPKLEYDRWYNKTHKEKIAVTKKKYREDNRPQLQKRWVENYHVQRERHPKKVLARKLLSAYVSEGKIIKKPCSVCSEEKVQGHHFDYDKPLEVIWLCLAHHRALHEVESSRLKKLVAESKTDEVLGAIREVNWQKGAASERARIVGLIQGMYDDESRKSWSSDVRSGGVGWNGALTEVINRIEKA